MTRLYNFNRISPIPSPILYKRNESGGISDTHGTAIGTYTIEARRIYDSRRAWNGWLVAS